MDNLEEKIRRLVSYQLNVLEHDQRCRNIEWSFLRQPLQDILIEPLISLVLQFMKEREEENKRLKSQLNQLSFQNDPNRDKKILELTRKGLSRRSIGREVQMSPWGVSKALRRLGVNLG